MFSVPTPPAVKSADHAPIWEIIERFYPAYAIYMRQHDRYEEMVAHYVQLLGKPRAEIRLEPKELSELLKNKEMERLRDNYLLPLKTACHSLFRTDDSTDFLDRLVNDIFHEISILKEEHYNVLTYAPSNGDSVNRGELETILDEVHTMFPIKVHRLKHLFELARGRIEMILPANQSNPVLIRSLFLYRHDFVARAYSDGLVQFYRVIYGADRPFDGYRAAGDSFLVSGFVAHALECHKAGAEFLKNVSAAAKRRFHPSWKEARAAFERATRECEQRLTAQDDE